MCYVILVRIMALFYYTDGSDLTLGWLAPNKAMRRAVYMVLMLALLSFQAGSRNPQCLFLELTLC